MLLVEGQKCVDAATELGLLATTFLGGSPAVNSSRAQEGISQLRSAREPLVRCEERTPASEAMAVIQPVRARGEELADLTGLSASMVSRVERGLRTLLPMTRVRVARRLGVPLRAIFDVEPVPEDESFRS